MASSQSPNRVFFSNLDRSANDTTTDFTINFDTPIQNAYNFEVVSSSFPNVMPPFASYETILYFYHASFNGGAVAIAIPMSTTQVGGTGESSPPAGRVAYIDKRFFADGTDLATYLTGWLSSLSSSWPTQASGLQPFYYTGDDPIGGTRTYLANQAATGITFSNLSFTYDDLVTNGTLKLTFADSTAAVVRIASVLDFGSLEDGTPLPSRMGFKLGYTDLENEAFGTLLTIAPPNNQFKLRSVFPNGTYNEINVVIPANDYTAAGLVTAMNTAIVVANKPSPFASQFTGVVVSQSASTLSIQFPTPTGATIVSYDLIFGTLATALALGFDRILTNTAVGGTAVAPSPIATSSQAPSPAQDIAITSINLVRTSSVFMASSLSSGESLTSQGRKDVLFAIPITAGIGAIQQYQSSLSGIVINRPPNAIRSLRMTMLDDLFQVLEPLPTNASVNVEIHFAFREDARTSQIDFRSTNLYA